LAYSEFNNLPRSRNKSVATYDLGIGLVELDGLSKLDCH
jgi:hypothetical protein